MDPEERSIWVLVVVVVRKDTVYSFTAESTGAATVAGNTGADIFRNVATPKVVSLPSDLVWSGDPELRLPDRKFSFVSMADAEIGLMPIAVGVSRNHGLDAGQVYERLHPLYEQFMHHCIGALRKAFEIAPASMRNDGPYEGLSITNLDPTILGKLLAAKLGDGLVIDLTSHGADGSTSKLSISRLYTPDGETLVRFAPRVGEASVIDQLVALRGAVKGRHADGVSILEDFVVTGSTLHTVINAMADAQLRVERVVAFGAFGNTASLPVDPVVRFVGSDPRKLLDRADLVEYREFLLGSGGCSTLLPSGKTGQAPYIFPFASPTKRASVPSETAAAFSTDILRANAEFYARASQVLGIDVRLADVRPTFAVAASELFGRAPTDAMTDVAARCIDRLAKSSTSVVATPSSFSLLRHLRLPQKIIFLDVNGTLIRPGESEVNALARAELITRCAAAEAAGYSIGLCSDSPLDGLQRLAGQLGITGPIIAENGALVANGNARPVVLRFFPNRETAIGTIERIAERHGVRRESDRWAVEFGGKNPNSSENTGQAWYAFGAGRHETIAVFGSPEFIAELGKVDWRALMGGTDEMTFDCNPHAGSYGFFSLQPLADYRAGKTRTLEALVQLGIQVRMIGDGESDVAPRSSGVVVGLVGNTKVDPSIIPEGSYSTPLQHALGAAHIMTQMIADDSGVNGQS